VGLLLLFCSSCTLFAQGSTPSGAGPVAASSQSGLTQEDVEKIVEKRLKLHATSQSTEKEPLLKSTWRNGFVAESADKAFRLHVGGLLHVDAGWWHPEEQVMYGIGGVGPLNDGAIFRRARIHLLGHMYENIEWTMEVGFENRLPQFFNAYAEVQRLPFFENVRIGHFREPFGMDALTSYNNLTFSERALVQDPFVPFFNMGVMIWGDWFDQRMTYASGVFRTNSDNFNAADFGDGSYSYTSRLTANPWYEDDGAYALHLGAAYSYRVLPRLNAQGQPVASGGERRIVFSVRPEERVNAPSFIGTEVLRANRENLVGAEFGLGLGPFLFQAEYMAAMLGNAALPAAPQTGGSAFFQGFYVQASAFLTGESRPYSRRDGIFGMVRPHHNFLWLRDGAQQHFGSGAWEVALRYSQVDLNHQNINGGNLRDLTIGLNWYLNPNCRVLWDYVLIWRDVPGNTSDGLTHVLGARFQLEF